MKRGCQKKNRDQAFELLMAVNGVKIERSSSTSMEENIHRVESVITKWDVAWTTADSSSFKSIFHESRDEARLFLDAVSDLNSYMNSSLSSAATQHDHSRNHRLIHTAVKRLQKEFYHILSTNRLRNREGEVGGDGSIPSTAEFSDDDDDDDQEPDRSCVDYSSDKEDVKYVVQSLGEEDRVPAVVAMADLKAIAESMVSSGYTKECVKIYRIIRKSIVEQGIYNLGFKRIKQSQLRKLESVAMAQRIDSWLAGSSSAIKALFSGERILCEYIFGSFSLQIKESCFADITREAAFQFLQFPELIAATMVNAKKKSHHNIYQLLDLYKTISDLFPDIQSVFSYESTSSVRSQAAKSFHKLADSIRAVMWDFESAIERHKFKGTVGGGGLHPLTVQTMNHLVFLSEYNTQLSTIFAEETISSRISRLLLLLLCKVDAKSEKYKDVGLSYIFMANNVHYMNSLVKESNLVDILGTTWVETQKKKVKSFTESYVKHAWRRVTAAMAEENVSEFNSAFLDAYRVQRNWVVVEQGRMRQEILATVKKKVLVPYGELYKKRTVDEDSESDVVRFQPDDVDEYIEGLFCGRVDNVELSGFIFESDSSSGSGSGSGSRHASNEISFLHGWDWGFLPDNYKLPTIDK